MTTADLILDLERDEGLAKLRPDGCVEAYPDPLHGWAVPTIGYGHTGPEVREGLVWTRDQCVAALRADIERASAGLDANLTWWRDLDDARQDVLANMAFNMGAPKLETFGAFLGLVRAGDYAAAGQDMLGTAWARQVKGRAGRLADQMETGVRRA